MRVVVDASIGVKWLLDETQSDIAERVLKEASVLLVPDLFPIEVASVLTKRLRMDEIDGKILDAITLQLESLVETSLTVEPTVPLLRRMVAISRRLHHSLYDCAYLALAEERAMPLVTSDTVFVRKLANTEWAILACPLADAEKLLV